MAIFRKVLIGGLCITLHLPVLAGVGSIDGRIEVDWSNYPQIVHLFITMEPDGSLGSFCTGQFVSPNLIITAAHCVKDNNGNVTHGDINVINSEKQEFYADLVKTTEWRSINSSDLDWAVLKVRDPQYYSKKWYNIGSIPSSDGTQVYNAGFGFIRVLTDDEIKTLREVYNNSESPISQSKLLQEFNNALESNIEDDGWEHHLKIHTGCHMTNSVSDCDTWSGNSGGPYVIGNNNLVAVHSTGVKLAYAYQFDDQYQQTEFSAVNNWENDLRQLISTYRVGSDTTPVAKIPGLNPADMLAQLNNPGDVTNAQFAQIDVPVTPDIPETPAVSNNTTRGQTLDKIPGPNPADMLAQLNNPGDVTNAQFAQIDVPVPVIPDVPDANGNTDAGQPVVVNTDTPSITNAVAQVSDDYTTAAIADINDKLKNIDEDFNNTVALGKNISDKQFLRGIVSNVVRTNQLKKLEDAYKKAKENETSLKNRLVSGLSMAATGIGGMQLAQGLAEQSADEAAERDMRAYMATFQCKIGDKIYKNNEKSIEVPGANQLTKIYQEYVDLAEKIKERKTALGMKPGIESQVVLKKESTGLYDNAGKGIENGTYASLYRAAMGNETDKTKINEAKDTSAQRVKGGAIAAGAGAIGGAVLGNIDFGSGNSSGNGDSRLDFSKIGNALGNKLKQ